MQLKYRAYIDGEFYYFDLNELANDIGYGSPLSRYNQVIVDWLKKGNQPDVFTGIKDAEGSDVYEKDIIMFDSSIIHYTEKASFGTQFEDDNKYIVKWSDECKSFDIDFKPNDTEHDKYLTVNLFLRGQDFKIIGNIHQNGDYLK